MVSLRRAALLALAPLCVACATPIQVETLPAADDQPVHKIALVPFALDLVAADPDAEPGPNRISALVTARVLEALSQLTSYDVVPPQETVRALAGEDSGDAGPAYVGEKLHGAFGVDAVLSGTVRRFRSELYSTTSCWLLPRPSTLIT